MPYTVPEPAPLYTAILARLRTSTGKEIGEAEAPPNNVRPYGVVFPLSDENTEGALSDPLQVVTFAVQVTCVGEGMAQTQWLQHRVRQALIGWIPTVAGVGTTPIELFQGSGVTRDDALSGNPTLFYSTDRFSARTSV